MVPRLRETDSIFYAFALKAGESIPCQVLARVLQASLLQGHTASMPCASHRILEHEIQ
jgi:hypothetical protein